MSSERNNLFLMQRPLAAVGMIALGCLMPVSSCISVTPSFAASRAHQRVRLADQRDDKKLL